MSDDPVRTAHLDESGEITGDPSWLDVLVVARAIVAGQAFHDADAIRVARALAHIVEAATVVANNPIGDNVLVDPTMSGPDRVPVLRSQMRHLRKALALLDERETA